MTLTDRVVGHALIEVTLRRAFHQGWNRVPGVVVSDAVLTVDPNEYFFRYENPVWLLADWNSVRDGLLTASETAAKTVEQQTLEFVRDHASRTTDPATVLATAEEVYGFLFRPELLADPDLTAMGVKEWHLRILREMGTMMALNRVELDGQLSNVGPAWFFGEIAKCVFDLTDEESVLVDELYHGTFFNEERRVESIKAHAALGGRLVHGCSGSPNQAGGCVVAYGTNVEAFQRQLRTLKAAWMAEIATYPRSR